MNLSSMITRSAPRVTSRRLAAAFAVLCAAFVTGCGGSDDYWDDYSPRAATVSDLSSRSFRFDWLPEGNPLDADVDTMNLSFGPMSTAGVGTATIEELDGGLAAASANFTESTGTLVITVSSTSGEIGVDVNQAITVKVDADNDGRIRLTDTARKIEATSRP